MPLPPRPDRGADPVPDHRDDLAAREQAALRRLASIVASGAASAEVFAAVAREVAQVTGMALVQIQRYGPDDDTVTVAGAWGAEPHPFQPGTTWGLEGSQIAGYVKRTRRAVRVDDFGAGTGPIHAGVRQTGIRGGAGAPIIVEGELWGVMAAGPAKGEPVPPGLEDRLAGFTELVATAIAGMDSREALARLADEQAALRRVATLVAHGVAPAEVFTAVAREAGRLLGVDAMHMGRYDAGAALCVAAWSPAGGHLPVGTRVELDGTNVASLVLRDGRPARIDGPSPPGGATADRLRHRMGVQSSVAVPIVVDGATWGLMIASAKRRLPADTEARLLGFTELAETSIANAEARAALGASRARLVAAADAERRRVVRDLHDGAQQRLVHTIVTLKLAERELQDQPGRASQLLKEALAHAEEATAELRELAHGILPGVLLRGGLRAGAEALASRMPVPVTIDVSTGRLAEHVEATAYFVVAEALTNVAKHARAQRATVSARVDGSALRIEVRDDGVGGARTEDGGLIGLRDRLATLDGTLAVDSRPGHGTVVSATIPLPAPG